jgi:hypothetical protein
MRSLLIRLYPARWRARYGDEFGAILEERPLGPFDVADILLGALDAQLRLRKVGADIAQGRGFSMSLRIGGFAAILGAALWPVGFFFTAGDRGDIGPIDPVVARLLLITGSLALLVALAGLSAFQARTHPGFAWAAFVIPAVGTIASMVGIVGFQLSEDYFLAWALGTITLFVGSGLFAIATYRTAALSRGAAVLLGVGSVLTMIFGMSGGGNPSPALMVAALSCFGLGWFALGVQAIRIDRPATEPRPA